MIIRFKEPLCNMMFKSKFEGFDSKGNVEIIKLAVGENTVIESKQRNKNAKLKVFRTGFPNLKVDGELFYQTEITDKLTIEFLQHHAQWDKMIFEYNPLEENKLLAEEAAKQAEIVLQATQLKDDDLFAMGCRIFGNEALKHKKENDEAGLKVKLITFSTKEPELFEKYLNDKDGNTNKWFVSLAFAKGIIKETKGGNAVAWGENGEEFLKVTKGKKAVDDVVDFFKTQEGREVRSMIGQYLGEKSVEAELEVKTKK